MTIERSLVAGVRGEFRRTLETADFGPFTALVDYRESNHASEEYAGLGVTPTVREATGGRLIKQLREQGFTIVNKEWENSFGILRKEYERGITMNEVDRRAAALANRFVDHRIELVSGLMADGPATVCYDGQYFFDTDHSEGDSGSQSNDIQVDISTLPVVTAGSVTLPSPAAMGFAMMQGVQQILQFKDDAGRPMNRGARSFQVQVPVSLLTTAAAAIRAPLVDNGQTNVTAVVEGFSISVHANPDLDINGWTDEFAVFRTDTDMKPFVYQEEIPPETDALDKMSEEAFKNFRYIFGGYARYNMGYQWWQSACLVTMI